MTFGTVHSLICALSYFNMENPFLSPEKLKEINEMIEAINGAFYDLGRAFQLILDNLPPGFLVEHKRLKRKELYERRYNRRKKHS